MRSTVWSGSQEASKLKTPLLWTGRKRAPYDRGFLHKLTWGLPRSVSKVEGTTMDHRVPCLFISFSLPLLIFEKKIKESFSFPKDWHHIVVFKITSDFTLVLKHRGSPHWALRLFFPWHGEFWRSKESLSSVKSAFLQLSSGPLSGIFTLGLEFQPA